MILAADFETGGTDPEQHAPVSLGLAVMGGDEVLASQHWIFGDQSKNDKAHMRRDYNVGALRISGYTWKQIQDGMPPEKVLLEVRQFLSQNGVTAETVIVSHNAIFDQRVLSDLCFRLGEFDRGRLKQWMPIPSPLVGPWACTQRMASNIPGISVKLDGVAQYFGLSQPVPHNALGDAILAGMIYDRLSKLSPEVGAV